MTQRNHAGPRLLLLYLLCSGAVWTACSSVEPGRYKIALVPSLKGQHGIFAMNSDSTGGKLLNSEPTAQLRSASWSPDGSRIVYFATTQGDADLLRSYRMPSHFPVYTMGAFGNNRKRLFDFPIGSFAWSPDGQKLLFVSAYEDPEHNDPAVLRGKRAPLSAVYLLDFKTGEQKRLTSFGQHCSGAFSPDNAQVALSFGDEKKSDIYVLSLDGMHARRLTDSAIINIQPAWSPDGKSLAYVAVSPSGTEGPESGVFVVENNGSKKRKAGDMTAFGVAWSPDGKLLLLESAEGFKLVDPAGVTTRDLALGAGRMLDAVFTPDGREVMFRSDHEGYWYIYARNLVSSKIRRVSGNLTASSFCLSPLLSKD